MEDVHHVHVWSLTPARPLLTMHVSVCCEKECATVLTQVKTILKDRFGIAHSTVQVETGSCADDK